MSDQILDYRPAASTRNLRQRVGRTLGRFACLFLLPWLLIAAIVATAASPDLHTTWHTCFPVMLVCNACGGATGLVGACLGNELAVAAFLVHLISLVILPSFACA
jgi:hypothetical protein